MGTGFGHWLQVTFPNRGCFVTGMAQNIDKGVRPHWQCATVVTESVNTRIAPGHEARAVGHADRRGHMKIVKQDAAFGERINIRRIDDRMPVAAKPVGPVLVSHDVEKIRMLLHTACTVVGHFPGRSFRLCICRGAECLAAGCTSAI